MCRFEIAVDASVAVSASAASIAVTAATEIRSITPQKSNGAVHLRRLGAHASHCQPFGPGGRRPRVNTAIDVSGGDRSPPSPRRETGQVRADQLQLLHREEAGGGGAAPKPAQCKHGTAAPPSVEFPEEARSVDM